MEAVAEAPQSLEETMVCFLAGVQLVFETLLVLVTGQLAIAGQLGREVHLQSIELLLGSRG